MSNEFKPAVAPQVQFEKTDRGIKIKIWGARALYANVNTPRPAQAARGTMGPKDAQYDCEFMLPKAGTTGLKELWEAINEFGKSAHNGQKWHNALISNPDKEIADLKERGLAVPESLQMKAGHLVIKAHSGVNYPPAVKGEIYSGCCAGAVIVAKAYAPKDGNSRGVNGFLNGVQFQGDGPRLGGGITNVDDELGAAPVSNQLPDRDDDFGAGAYTGSNAPSRSGDDERLPF